MIHTTELTLSWMIYRDVPDVVQMDRECFPWGPWEEADYLRLVRKCNAIGLVFQYREVLVASVMYKLRRRAIQLLRLAVDPDYQRQGIGKAIIERLLSKASAPPRNKIAGWVHERNLPAQLFFRAVGFQAEKLAHRSDGDDEILFARHFDAATDIRSSEAQPNASLASRLR